MVVKYLLGIVDSDDTEGAGEAEMQVLLSHKLGVVGVW
jgi:hypothetical protein